VIDVVAASPAASDITTAGRIRRFAVVAAILGVVLSVLWWSRVVSGLCNSRARRLIAEDHLGQAQTWLDRSRLLNDGNPETFLLLARVDRKLQRLDDFQVHLRQAVQAKMDRRVIEREQVLMQAAMGRASAHLNELAEYMIRQDGDEAEVCSAFVNGFVIEQQFDRAFTLIDLWKSGFPEDPRPFCANGRIQSFLGKAELAAAEYRRGLELCPDHYPSAVLLGRYLRESHDVDEAKVLFERCLTMRWNSAPQLELAKCLREMNDVDRARTLLIEVLNRPTDEVELSYLQLGESLFGDPAAAELGSLELAANRSEDALRYFQQAYAADPTDLDVRYGRALALRQTGNLAETAKELEAVNAARTALREADTLVDAMDPVSPHVEQRIRIGEIYLQHGSARVAEYWLKSALAFDPAARRAHELLAELYERRMTADPKYRPLVEHHRRLAGRTSGESAATRD